MLILEIFTVQNRFQKEQLVLKWFKSDHCGESLPASYLSMTLRHHLALGINLINFDDVHFVTSRIFILILILTPICKNFETKLSWKGSGKNNKLRKKIDKRSLPVYR